jgi:CheY-like chemotaxis protein
MGLALAKRLVEMHKESVEARSQGPGKGAQFVVRRPVLADNRAATEQAGVETAAKGCGVDNPPRRILVVDDNEDSAESMAQLLELNGHLVEQAHDGQNALKTFERFHPDVILLDIGLPEMDGYEVCQTIRRNQSKHRPIVVALTGWGQDSDRRKSLEAGFDHHLVKPASFEALMKLLTRLNVNNNPPAAFDS